MLVTGRMGRLHDVGEAGRPEEAADQTSCTQIPAAAAPRKLLEGCGRLAGAFINSLTTLPQVYNGHREVVSSILGGGVEGL